MSRLNVRYFFFLKLGFIYFALFVKHGCFFVSLLLVAQKADYAAVLVES